MPLKLSCCSWHVWPAPDGICRHTECIAMLATMSTTSRNTAASLVTGCSLELPYMQCVQATLTGRLSQTVTVPCKLAKHVLNRQGPGVTALRSLPFIPYDLTCNAHGCVRRLACPSGSMGSANTHSNRHPAVMVHTVSYQLG
jgi:hypothetical protein